MANGTTTLGTLVLASSTMQIGGSNYILPSADGTNGQALTTNGNRVLSFTSIAVVSANSFSIATSSPSALANLTVNGGIMAPGATSTVGKLVIASSTIAANGLTYALPNSHTVPPSGFTASSTLFNNGNGTLAWGLPEDYGASTTNTNWIGTGVYTHSLGRIPKFLKIHTTGNCDEAGTGVSCYSVGIATSTRSTSPSARTIGQAIRAAATIAYGNWSNSSSIVYLEDANSGVDLEAALLAWDSTTFTLNFTTNVNAGGIKRLLWEIR